MLPLLSPEGRISCATLLASGGLSDEACARLDPELNVRQYLDALLADGQVSDALDVLARVLPPAAALQWGCACLAEALGQDAADRVERSALLIARRCLDDPADEHYQDALDFAERLAYRTPGAWLAAAAGWAGGRLLPAGQAEVPAAAAMPGIAVVAALRLQAAADPARYEQWLRDYIDDALALFATTPDERTPSS